MSIDFEKKAKFVIAETTFNHDRGLMNLDGLILYLRQFAAEVLRDASHGVFELDSACHEADTKDVYHWLERRAQEIEESK